MSLKRLIADFLAWYKIVLLAFYNVKRLSGISIVCMSLASKVFTLMAFLLPLKIIIMAGSDGIPKYFSGFIEYQNKGEWILLLSVAALGFYLICLVLDVIVDAETTSGARKFVATIGSQRGVMPELAKVKNYYSLIWQILTDALFVVACLITISLLNGTLFLVLFLLVFLEFWVTSALFRKAIPGISSRLGKWLYSDIKGYLNIFVSLNFLLAFATIVSPFLFGLEADVLLSIASLILCRHLLTALGQLISVGVRLSRSRDRIETLAYELRSPSDGVELSAERNLVFLSDQERRKTWLCEILNGAGCSPNSIESAWVDFHIQKIYVFLVRTLRIDSAHEHCFQVQIFDSTRKQLYRNEYGLFNLVDRRELSAPNRIRSADEIGFCYQVLEVGSGKFVSKEEWRLSFKNVLIQHWSVEPPEKLVSQFSGNTQLIQEKFSDRFFSCLELAVTSESESSNLSRFFSYLPRIREILSAVPLYVYNQDVRLGNVFYSEDDSRYYVMSWGRWSLDPIGAMLPGGISLIEINEMIYQARQGRGDMPSDFDATHISFVAKLYKVVSWVKSGKYGAALEALQTVLESPLILTTASEVVCE
ncbi:hypothetical protein [Microbulbifer sp. TYP-18]|uniref:hypothetical protein n=1 Tax=Microbulbifer sp. TYP-18 TaxID=3230024 RepID=UPI0034C67FC8